MMKLCKSLALFCSALLLVLYISGCQALPGSKEARLGFLMYPVAETVDGRADSYAPDTFKYQITAREIKA